jgi:hypothetical protein
MPLLCLGFLPRFGFQSLHRGFDDRQPVFAPSQFVRQLVAAPRTQSRVFLVISLLGSFGWNRTEGHDPSSFLSAA